jgi:hypothetical protein
MATLLQLLTDPELRKKQLKNPKCIWHNNNPRKPIISKSAGMLNRYHNELIPSPSTHSSTTQ